MSGKAVKVLKQSLKTAKDDVQIRDASVALLRHSLRFGHRRLSLRRLEAAVHCGAELTADDLHRCADLVLQVDDAIAHARLARVSRQLTMSAAAHSEKAFN